MSFFPERLSWIRKKRGLTKTEVAKAIDLDLRSITAYESGEFEPTEQSLERLASKLDVQVKYFSLGPVEGPNPDQVSFRALSKLTASKRDMALGSATIAFEFNNWIESKFNLPKLNLPDLREITEPKNAAQALRFYWGCGQKPISNMIHLMESNGIKVFSLALDMSEVDAFCTWRDQVPFIFLNTKKSNARRRFDAAHELGHIILHYHGDFRGKQTEREADEFASAFLMPRDGFSATAPRLANLKNIIPAKQRWGVSVAAYIVRLNRLGLISDWQYRTLFKQISQRGYRKAEPLDHKIEMSKLAELILRELRTEGMNISDIGAMLGVSKSDITDLLFDLAVISIDGDKSSDVISSTKNHLRLAVDNG